MTDIFTELLDSYDKLKKRKLKLSLVEAHINIKDKPELQGAHQQAITILKSIPVNQSLLPSPGMPTGITNKDGNKFTLAEPSQLGMLYPNINFDKLDKGLFDSIA